MLTQLLSICISSIYDISNQKENIILYPMVSVITVLSLDHSIVWLMSVKRKAIA